MILHEKTTPETKKSDRSRSFRCLICVYAGLRESLDHPLQVQLHEPLLRMLGDRKSSTVDLQPKIQTQVQSD